MPSGSGHYITVTCPTCRGEGRRGNKPCSLCNGRKTIQVPPDDDDDD